MHPEANGQNGPATGILLTNLGTPDAPTTRAVRRYLAEFLADPRVVEIPPLIWLPVLHGIILNTRPQKSAAAYRTVWTDRGSPLLVFTLDLGDALLAQLRAYGHPDVQVAVGMRYGNPSIATGLDQLRGCSRIIVIPMYPQFAAATTASTFDALAAHFRTKRYVPTCELITDYHLHPAYVAAIADTLRAARSETPPERLLLFSFHGLPARCRQLGDPYYDQCLASASAIASAAGLSEGSWRVVFQSRFGPAEWLKPYCVDTLKELPKTGVTEVDVICPGFSVDCLETLEEIAVANREVFIEAGGSEYRYIPALNDSSRHVDLLMALLEPRLSALHRQS